MLLLYSTTVCLIVITRRSLCISTVIYTCDYECFILTKDFILLFNTIKYFQTAKTSKHATSSRGVVTVADKELLSANMNRFKGNNKWKVHEEKVIPKGCNCPIGCVLSEFLFFFILQFLNTISAGKPITADAIPQYAAQFTCSNLQCQHIHYM
jgi:hypothetical protein